MCQIKKVFLYLIIWLVFIPVVKGQYGSSKEILRIGDAVRVEIWDIAAATTSDNKNSLSNIQDDYIIDANGRILMPIIGLVSVYGKTPKEVEEILVERYKEWFKEPFVYIRPLIRITVMGEVARPGAYRTDPRSSLWELLANAGGTTSSADLKKMVVFRGGEKVIGDLLKSFENAISLEEVGIQSGDQILVPSRGGFHITDILTYANFAASLTLIYLRIQRYK